MSATSYDKRATKQFANWKEQQDVIFTYTDDEKEGCYLTIEIVDAFGRGSKKMTLGHESAVELKEWLEEELP
jgi:hypothetical protein